MLGKRDNLGMFIIDDLLIETTILIDTEGVMSVTYKF